MVNHGTKNEIVKITTVTPYMVGMVNHAMNNETVKITDSVYLVCGTVMEREDRLRRRREQYHARINRKTAEERELRLEARRSRERCHCAVMSTEWRPQQRQMLLQWRRKSILCSLHVTNV